MTWFINRHKQVLFEPTYYNLPKNLYIFSRCILVSVAYPINDQVKYLLQCMLEAYFLLIIKITRVHNKQS